MCVCVYLFYYFCVIKLQYNNMRWKEEEHCTVYPRWLSFADLSESLQSAFIVQTCFQVACSRFIYILLTFIVLYKTYFHSFWTLFFTSFKSIYIYIKSQQQIFFHRGNVDAAGDAGAGAVAHISWFISCSSQNTNLFFVNFIITILIYQTTKKFIFAWFFLC